VSLEIDSEQNVWFVRKASSAPSLQNETSNTGILVDARGILRVKDWTVALLVSEVLRDALVDNVKDLGVVLQQVSR
jgi:hypothetical protein